MEVTKIDATGLRCPQPVLKLAMALVDVPAGALVEITGDCPTFEKDIRTWCEKRGKTVLSVRPEGDAHCIQIQV